MLDAASTGSPTSSRSQDIAAPDKFSDDRKPSRTFEAQIQRKLAGDACKFRDDQHKMMYITSLLDGNAHRMIHHYIVDDRINFNPINQLWNILDCTSNDPNRRGTAERELRMLKQGTSELSAYFDDFQRILAELQWDPSAKKAALRQGIVENLKDLLLLYDCPDDWSPYIRLLQRFDSKLQQREAEQNKETTNMSSKTTLSTSSAAPSSTTHITSNPAYLGPAPMGLSAAQKQAEREHYYQDRRSGGLCTYCGMADQFRAASPRRKRHLLAVAVATLTPPLLRIEETLTAGKDQSHAARLAPPWDVAHLSHLLFVVRRKDRWNEGSNCEELRCRLQKNLSLLEITS